MDTQKYLNELLASARKAQEDFAGMFRVNVGGGS